MAVTFDTRDTRGGGREIKFLVAPDRSQAIVDWARARLGPDPFGTGAAGDEYVTSSLYFDTASFAVLGRRGSFGRSKYRVRRYNGADVVFVERKLRTRSLVAKRRTLVDLAALAALAAPGGAAWPGRWFARRLAVRGLRPVCQVTYQRVARLAMTDRGPIRLTLDTAIEARGVSAPAFVAPGGVPALAGRAILELKFMGPPPAAFKSLVEAFGLAPAPISKYRLAMAALGMGVAGPAAPGEVAAHA